MVRRKVSSEFTAFNSRDRPLHRLNCCDMLRRKLVVRVQPQRRVELLERRSELPLFRKCNTKIQMGTSVIGTQPNHRLNLLFRFRESTENGIDKSLHFSLPFRCRVVCLLPRENDRSSD
jgi:hypothetical protein